MPSCSHFRMVSFISVGKPSSNLRQSSTQRFVEMSGEERMSFSTLSGYCCAESAAIDPPQDCPHRMAFSRFRCFMIFRTSSVKRSMVMCSGFRSAGEKWEPS